VTEAVAKEYLFPLKQEKIDTLILGCTHYPLIRKEISDFYSGKVTVLDSSEVVAKALHSFLASNQLLRSTSGGPDHFLVSDYTDSFEASTKLFFQEAVHLEKHHLWND